MSTWRLAGDALANSLILGWTVGAYAAWSIAALVVLRHMPRMVELELGGQRYVGVLPRSFIRRVHLYAWPGVAGLVFLIVRMVWGIVRLF